MRRENPEFRIQNSEFDHDLEKSDESPKVLITIDLKCHILFFSRNSRGDSSQSYHLISQAVFRLIAEHPIPVSRHPPLHSEFPILDFLTLNFTKSVVVAILPSVIIIPRRT
jgi:hypothetical protein